MSKGLNMVQEIALNLYCDEIHEQTIRDETFGDEKWAYIGILIVPVEREEELILNLLNKRCGNPDPQPWATCSPLCKFHSKNDKEVHYNRVDSMNEYFIADRWLDFLLYDISLTYFYILGINLTNLDYRYFGVNRGNGKYCTLRLPIITCPSL